MENIKNLIREIADDARDRAAITARRAVNAACSGPMAGAVDVDGFEPELLRDMLDGNAMPPLDQMKWLVDRVEYAPGPRQPGLEAQASLVAAILDRAGQDVRCAAAEIILCAALSTAGDEALSAMDKSARAIAKSATEGIDGPRLARQLRSLEGAARAAGDKAEILAYAASAAADLLAVL